jgi:TolC family type I secretion outer membrane protein
MFSLLLRVALRMVCACVLAVLLPDTARAASLSAVPMHTGDTALKGALAYVYLHNPRLESARAELKVADERVAEAVSGFRPTITANGDIGRQREQTQGQNWLYGEARDESLQLNQPIFNGFGTLAQMKAAKERVKAGRAHLKAVEQTVLLEAVSAYMEVISRRYILQFSRDNADRLGSYVGSTQKRLNAGDGTMTDLAQAQSRSAQAQSGVAMAEANWQAAVATYERIFGMPPQTEDFPAQPAGLPVSAEEAEMLARNAPELAEAMEQEKAARHDIDVASSAFWPSVSLRAGTSEQRSPDLGLQNLRDDSITINVSIPLYAGGGEYARQREARELHAKSVDDMLDVERVAIERARQAWYNHEAAWQALGALRQTCEASARALHGFEIEERQGMRSLTDTLEARSDFFTALTSEVEAEENVRLQAYRVLEATGQLTASHLELPVAAYDPTVHYDKVEGEWF